MRNHFFILTNAIAAALGGATIQLVPASRHSLPGRTNQKTKWKRMRRAGFNRGGYRSKSKRAKKFTT